MDPPIIKRTTMSIPWGKYIFNIPSLQCHKNLKDCLKYVPDVLGQAQGVRKFHSHQQRGDIISLFNCKFQASPPPPANFGHFP